jgi:predicted double-glycine peptidase
VERAAWSGAAALATVSAHHGVAVAVRELAELTHTEELAEVEEGNVLVMGRGLGFEATAMEGGYGDLPDVALPLLVALREEGRDRYAVLFAFDDTSATVGDPATGEVKPWTRERFCALWTGSVIQVLPIEDERRALEARLVDLRDGVKRALRAVGWTPPYGPKYAMLAAWVLLAGVAVAAPRTSALDAAWIALITTACAAALWSWLVICPKCSRARQLAGDLPLAPAGALLYAALLGCTFAPVPAMAVTLVVGAAVGAHVALVAALFRAKLACTPCLLVAACAFGAGAITLLRDDAHAALYLLAAAAAGAALFASLPAARAREVRSWRTTAESIAKRVLAEPGAEGGAGVRVVAYKRVGCGACAFFEAAVKPALLATFGDVVTIEERDLGDARTAAPVVIVVGARRHLFIGLPDENAPGRIIDAVREAIESEPAPGGAMTTHVG